MTAEQPGNEDDRITFHLFNPALAWYLSKQAKIERNGMSGGRGLKKEGKMSGPRILFERAKEIAGKITKRNQEQDLNL